MSNNSDQVIIGRDATVFSIEGGGSDDGVYNGAGATNILGVYKEIQITISREWVEVTPSSAGKKEKRRTVADWKASLKNLVRDSMGPVGYQLAEASDYVGVTFTLGGISRTIYGGIAEGSLGQGKEAAEDGLEIENVGFAIDGILNFS